MLLSRDEWIDERRLMKTPRIHHHIHICSVAHAVSSQSVPHLTTIVWDLDSDKKFFFAAIMTSTIILVKNCLIVTLMEQL